jgi:D-3-phosphoglycerate dehydrogenase
VKKYVVVVADRVADAGLRLLQAVPEFEVVAIAGSPERLPQELWRAHALIVRSDTQVTEREIAEASRLSVVGRAGTGVDNIDVPAATRRGIAVLNAPGANTVSASEHAIALLFALVRRIPWAASSMKEGRWDRKRYAGTELFAKRLGVVGLGRVGLRVASTARTLGMDVTAHDPYLPEKRARESNITLVPLDELLASVDVVSLHLPLTEKTHQLINRERLALMKPGAVLINTARGGLIDDGALLEAIDRGGLAGAALDVFDPEPLPADSPLRASDRILLTPHLAASTSEAQDRVAVEICSYVRDALLTGALSGAVNLPGVSSDVLGRLADTLEMARRLGRLAAALARHPVSAIEVLYGGNDEAAPKPVMLAAVEGLLSAMSVERVSLVNAAERARQRGISASRRVGAPLPGFETTIGVTIGMGEQSLTVEGAMLGSHVGRVIAIDRFTVDVPAEGNMVVLWNRDVPGVIGRVGSVLGDAKVNISSYHQSRRAKAGSEALAAIVVDQAPDEAVLSELAALEDVIDVRSARLNGVVSPTRGSRQTSSL